MWQVKDLVVVMLYVSDIDVCKGVAKRGEVELVSSTARYFGKLSLKIVQVNIPLLGMLTVATV